MRRLQHEHHQGRERLHQPRPAARSRLGLVGRKGRDFFKRRGFEVRIEEIGIFQRVKYVDAKRIAQAAIEEFTSGRVSKVFIVYNEFKSVMQQRVTTEQLLPIPNGRSTGSDAAVRLRAGQTRRKAPVAGDVDYIYEPGPAQILGDLLPKHIEIQVYRALLESAAAEHAARMTAMDAATKNSGEIIDTLTLYMNKVRQAAITREIIEVVSGAAAAKMRLAVTSGENEWQLTSQRSRRSARSFRSSVPSWTSSSPTATCRTSTTPSRSRPKGKQASRRSTSSARSSSISASRACARSR